jgi:hypothetical protein
MTNTIIFLGVDSLINVTIEQCVIMYEHGWIPKINNGIVVWFQAER